MSKPYSSLSQQQTAAPWQTKNSSTNVYANEVQVERGEHDAVLRFHRVRGESSVLVKEITVPLGVLEWLVGGAA